MNTRDEYKRWLREATEDGLTLELQAMDDAFVEDAFYRDLAFGTGGLRGIIGAGTNRMNVYTVARASQGLANYLLSRFSDPSVAIAYDSRHKSDLFSRIAAEVFVANGIHVWRYENLMPTPCLSYAVRILKCSAGIVITASHNPAKYNGYKVYGADGCQITTEAAAAIQTEIQRVDVFRDVKRVSADAAFHSGLLKSIPTSVYDSYIVDVQKQSVLFGDSVQHDISIVYSPLNGTGLNPVTRVLDDAGFTNITVVKEQQNPDGDFPTCPYPNPEIREAMALGLEYCSRFGADLLLATDPDADRCGVAVKSGPDKFRLLTGNEVGLLLLDFICSQRKKHGKMPPKPVFIKTIVTMDLAEKIAEHYGCRTINVLTGFKFIGEQIGYLEKNGRESDYIFGFEESYGYLTGGYVRDKDAVNAALLICEMFAYYKTRGVSLLEKLSELFDTYGFSLNTLHSYECNGAKGLMRMAKIMCNFRSGVEEIAGQKVIRMEDYSRGLNGLPVSDVIKYTLDNASVVIRPSGTEPKLKAYISVTAKNREMAEKKEKQIAEYLERFL